MYHAARSDGASRASFASAVMAAGRAAGRGSAAAYRLIRGRVRRQLSGQPVQRAGRFLVAPCRPRRERVMQQAQGEIRVQPPEIAPGGERVSGAAAQHLEERVRVERIRGERVDLESTRATCVAASAVTAHAA
jgi:hypothetical protein